MGASCLCVVSMVTECPSLGGLGGLVPGLPVLGLLNLLKTFLFPEGFGVVLCHYSGFEADFSYSDFNPLCV